jgi:hypothetical protein
MRVRDLDGAIGWIAAKDARRVLEEWGARISHQKTWGVWRRQVGLVDANGPTKTRSLTQRQFFLMMIRLRYQEFCIKYSIEARDNDTINYSHLEDIGDRYLSECASVGIEDAVLRLMQDNKGAVPGNKISEVIEAWTGKKPSTSTIYRRQRKAKLKPSQARRHRVSVVQVWRISIA